MAGKPPFAGCELGRRRPGGPFCGAGHRRRGSRVAQIGLRVRFRTGRGVFWHGSAFVSDFASGLGPTLPSHRRSTCGNARQLFSAWFFWLAESDTKADPCQKTPLPVRNRTRRPICAMASPPRAGDRQAPPSRTGPHVFRYCPRYANPTAKAPAYRPSG